MKIQPIGDKVVIEVLLDDKETSGGIVLSEEARKRNNKGLVTAVGDGIQLPDGSVKELAVKEGQTILYTSGAGLEVKIEGREYRIISIRDVMGIMVD